MDTRLKERLVGAVALVLIVVLVVPELLTGPHKPAPAPAVEGPAPVRTVVVDLAQSESGPVTRPAAEAAPAPAPDGANPPAGDGTTAAPPPLAAAPPVRTPATAAATEAAKPAASPTEPARAEPPKGDAPKAEPPKAEGSKAPPAKVASEPAKSPPAPAAKPAPAEPEKVATEASKAARPAKAAVVSGEGWVVQLGSFASRDNGEKLAKTLRGKGYRAFVSEFRGSGRVLYRVRVGPEQDRSRAEAIAARLARDGYKGSVAPH